VLAAGPRGAVLLLEWKNFQALLPIGIDLDMLELLRTEPRLKDIDVLLLSEGGLAAVNPPEWIAHLHPEVILLSVGVGNREELPSPETLDAAHRPQRLDSPLNRWGANVGGGGDEVMEDIPAALASRRVL
jgi:hypothetical protein